MVQVYLRLHSHRRILMESLRTEAGQDLVEYALLVGFIAILLVAAVTGFKDALVAFYNAMATSAASIL